MPRPSFSPLSLTTPESRRSKTTLGSNGASCLWNLKPAAAPDGFPFRWVWLDFGCLALMGGVLAKVFLRDFAAHAPFPIKDPRLGEAMGLRSPVPAQISGGESDESDER